MTGVRVMRIVKDGEYYFLEIENSIKLTQKSAKAKQYKPIFYYKNFKNIAERQKDDKYDN